MLLKPAFFQHFRFSPPARPLIYSFHLPSKLSRLPFSFHDHLFSWILWKCAPRPCRKHNSEYSHKAFLIEHITFWTSKRPESSPCWWWFSALSFCCSLLSPSIPSMPPKLDLKKRQKYMYYCYRRPPWATSMVYPTSFWWHLDVSNTILVVSWCIRHYFGSMFHFPATFFNDCFENMLPARIGNTILDIATKQF